MNTVENPDGPWTKPWPAAGLDLVAQCPVCGKSDRGILHPERIDNVFRVPGELRHRAWHPIWAAGNPQNSV